MTRGNNTKKFHIINSSPDDLFSDIFKPKAFCKRQFKDGTNDGIENIVGKGENAGYQHFLLFPLYFQRRFR